MNKTVAVLAGLVVAGAAAFGGWVYAGKPDLLAMVQGEREPGRAPAAKLSAETSAVAAKFTDILNQQFVFDGGTETTAESVSALLPDSVTLTIESSSFDTASGATVWTGVSLLSDGEQGSGVTADEVKLWGLNTDAIAARVAGTNLSETVKLAERIEARGVKSVGLETLMADVTTAYVDGINEAVIAVAPEEGITDDDLEEIRAAMEMAIDTYIFEIDHIVAVGPQLRPWEMKPVDLEAMIETEDEGQAVLLVLQKAAAYYRAFGVDQMIWSGTRFEMVMQQDGVKQDARAEYGLVGYSGWYGGDIDESILTNFRMSQKVDMREAFEDVDTTPEGAPNPFEEMDMDFVIQSAQFTGMKLDKVLRYLAMGELPPTEDTDLMAYGRVDMRGMSMALNDQKFFAVDTTILDFTDWHWFIPAKAEITLDGFEYDIAGIAEMMRPMMEAEDPDGWTTVEQALDIAEKYDALPFLYDQTYLWDWNPETGAFSFKSPQTHRNFGRANFELAGTLPNFEQGVAAVKEDMAYVPDPDADFWDERMREKAWDKVFEDNFSVTGGLLVLEDQGGLDKLFPMISELAQLDPDASGPMMANSTPEALRSMAVSTIGMGAFEAGKEVPQAEAWVMAFADWVRDGGTFRLELSPSEPLGPHLTEKYPNPSPEQIVDILGFSVTHTKP